MHKTGLLDLLTGSDRPHTSRGCVMQRGAVADWWYSWPMASTLASLCLSQRRTFWTHVVTISLFSLYLMNFTFHIMLDAPGVVLRVHYKSMKCDVLFSLDSVASVWYLGEVDIFSYMRKMSSSLQQCKNYKNRLRFSTVMVTKYCHLFMVHSVCHTVDKAIADNLVLVERRGFKDKKWEWQLRHYNSHTTD